MYLFGSRNPRAKDRSRSNRKTAAHKAKNRRRVNRMAGKKLGQRLATNRKRK
jgi:hypothetical protein